MNDVEQVKLVDLDAYEFRQSALWCVFVPSIMHDWQLQCEAERGRPSLNFSHQRSQLPLLLLPAVAKSVAVRPQKVS